jgi:site-specific DNA-cytosine methylase
MTYTYISNQGFAGGFDVGMTWADFELIHKVEMKGGFGLQNCIANRDVLGHSWSYQAANPSEWEAPSADVVIGNPPCSGFSVMSSKEFRGANSKINSCMWSFVEYVARVRPQVAVFESVQQAFTKPDGLELMRALRVRLEHLTGDTWTLYHVRHNAYSVGGAAQRRRYFWLVSRVPFGIEIPEITVQPMLNDVIGDLADLDITWSAQPYRSSAHEWAEHLRSPTGHIDGHWSHDDTPLAGRIHDLMMGIEWRPGDHIGAAARRHYEKHGRLPDSFERTAERIIANDFNMGFTTPTRWDGTKHARVITGGAMCLVIHPTLDRMITHREAARIMGFPDDWRIEPLRDVPGLGMTWGKGITTHCGKWIGEWIHRALDGQPGTYTGSQLGETEFDIDVTHAWRGKSHAVRRLPRTIQRNSDIIKESDAHEIMLPSEGNYMTETTQVDASRRGRPRSVDTIQRDELIFEALETPATREQLVERTGHTKSEVYLSLHRLRNSGRVERARAHGAHMWSRVADTAAESDSADTTEVTEEQATADTSNDVMFV